MTLDRSLSRIVFFLLLFLCIITATPAKSQVLYTDIIPDHVINCGSYNYPYYYDIDIDHDSILDLVFERDVYKDWASPTTGFVYGEYVGIDTFANANIGWVDMNYVEHGPCANIFVDSGTMINEQSFYWKSHTVLRYERVIYFIWCDQVTSKRFIAVRLIKDGVPYYGWIRMGNIATIRDMAINLNPFDSIIAGQKEGEKKDYSAPTVIIFPNPVQDNLIIHYNLIDESFFELYNLLGEKIKVVTLESGLNSKKIDLVGLIDGLYIYSIRDTKGNKIKTGKLFIQK
jgi:hypothetical protein